MVASIGKIASPAQGVSYFEKDDYYAKDEMTLHTGNECMAGNDSSMRSGDRWRRPIATMPARRGVFLSWFTPQLDVHIKLGDLRGRGIT